MTEQSRDPQNTGRKAVLGKSEEKGFHTGLLEKAKLLSHALYRAVNSQRQRKTGDGERDRIQLRGPPVCGCAEKSGLAGIRYSKEVLALISYP